MMQGTVLRDECCGLVPGFDQCHHMQHFKSPDVATGEDLVEAGGKMAVLDRLLAKLKGRGHRVTLFSQFKMQLDLLEDYCIMRGYKYASCSQFSMPHCTSDASDRCCKPSIADSALWGTQSG